MGSDFGNLSRRSQTSCLSLHHNVSAHGLYLRRTDPGFRYSQPDLARRLDHPRARFCQASADLHCRCSSRPENRAASSEEFSDSGQTFGGTVPAGGAHRGRCDLSDALGLASSPIPIPGQAIFLWPGLALVVLAIAIIIWVRKSLRASSTNISPFRPTTSIVTSGPFRFSRSPLYVALTLLYRGSS
ncbi:MAG: hypothetical protein DMF21_05915 [Verrucomicrobia bacterium]|nr:MAG: hypothetical protein DMF21_05915 [Verrucomicrobiota bacterium]